MLMRLVVTLILLVAQTGCAVVQSMNPAFPISHADARAEWDALAQQKKPFERPVLVLGGIYDPGFASSSIARKLRRCTPDQAQVIPVGYPGFGSFESHARKAVEYLERRYPSESANETIEVDVVGYSMGGIVGRYAAMSTDNGRKRLKIRRLFTISSPHRGARLAALPLFFDRRVAEMRCGSVFLASLDVDLSGEPFELICYARLGDLTVGSRNTSPMGVDPFWVPNRPVSMGHISAAFDKRILLDIARRLRGEDPITNGQTTSIP
jgi:hypothetical protein